jgi:hypothetical protein
MRHLLLSCLYLVSVNLSLGQQNKIAIDVIINPTLSGRYLDAAPEVRKQLNEACKPIASFDAGLLIKVLQKNAWQLQSGAVYARKGFSYGKISYKDNNNEPTGSLVARYRVDFLEVPVRFVYNLPADERSYLVVGVLQDILISDEVVEAKATFDAPQIDPDTPARKYNIGLQLGYRYILSRKNSFEIGIEPSLKWQFLSMWDQKGTAQMHLFTAGVSVVGGLRH